MTIFEGEKNKKFITNMGIVFAICFILSRAMRLYFSDNDSSSYDMIVPIVCFAAVIIVFLIINISLFIEKIIFRDTELKLTKGLRSKVIPYEKICSYIYTNKNEIVLQTENGDISFDVTIFDKKDEIIKELEKKINA